MINENPLTPFVVAAVGVLDAVTHFAASIHDIAKSVNVLDRRLRPALKLRLPYTFGMMSILAPFDPAAARAAQILKRFPFNGSRRTSANVAPETMIHVEILPSTGTETFAIATTTRVILVRVKKESSGSLTTSLCWEVAFTDDATITSRVDDHGHNGVALTLLKRGHDNSGKNEPKEVGTFEMRTNVSRRILASASLQSIGLPTEAEERISAATTAEEYDYGTGRGAEGDLLEWFTTLAEYQYRRQLTRMHNAISCISGNFDSIVRDASLGRPSSTEGYTSFGMYFFERNSASDEDGEFTGLVNRLENLPWVRTSTFDEAHDKTTSEQKLYLSRLREESDFASDLEASRREGGPEWLIVGRARVTFVDNEVSTASLSTEDVKPTRTSSLIGRQLLPSIKDEETDEDDTETKAARESLSRYTSAKLFDSDGSDSQISCVEDGDRLGDLNSHAAASRVNGRSTELNIYGYQSPSKTMQSRFAVLRQSRSMSESSDHSILSFQTAAASTGLARGPNGRGSLSHSTSSYDDRLLGATSDHFESSTASLYRASSTPAHDESKTTPQVNAAGRQKTADNHAHQQQQQPQQQQSIRQGEDRMDRMEALLERLLIFSSEQALREHQQPRVVVDHDEAASLRHEISELRSLIAQQEQRSRATDLNPQDVAALREDVATLRAQLGLPNAGDQTQTPGDGGASMQQVASIPNAGEWPVEQID